VLLWYSIIALVVVILLVDLVLVLLDRYNCVDCSRFESWGSKKFGLLTVVGCDSGFGSLRFWMDGEEGRVNYGSSLGLNEQGKYFDSLFG